MKNLITLTIGIIFICFTNSAQELRLNKDKSIILWTGKAAFNSYALTGNLQGKSGIILIQNDTIKNLEVIIDMKSLNHKNKDLKKHLRNKDFFEVNKYPKATFKLSQNAILIDNKAVLTGIMTIKNITKKEVIKVTVLKNKELKISFETTLDRTKYGVKFNSPSFFKKMKENAIADKFKLKCDLVFN